MVGVVWKIDQIYPLNQIIANEATRLVMRQFVLAILMFFLAALPVGAAEVPENFEKTLDDYVQNASFLIRTHIDWRMVQDSDAEAVVVIRIGANGVLESVNLTERSGNPSFDVALEAAVRRSIPMLRSPPVPPDGATSLSIPMRFRVLRWN
jgi:TonB family protein